MQRLQKQNSCGWLMMRIYAPNAPSPHSQLAGYSPPPLLPRINQQEPGSLAPSLEEWHCSHLPSGRPCMEWSLGCAGIWPIYLMCLPFPPHCSGIWLHGFIFCWRDMTSVQVEEEEEEEHLLHVSVVPAKPAWWWSSECSMKFWYEGVGSPRQESVIFLMGSSPAFSSSLAAVAGGYFREKKLLFVKSTGDRTGI